MKNKEQSSQVRENVNEKFYIQRPSSPPKPTDQARTALIKGAAKRLMVAPEQLWRVGGSVDYKSGL